MTFDIKAIEAKYNNEDDEGKKKSITKLMM